MLRLASLAILAATLMLAPTTGAQADRAPTAEERTSIETALRAAGFTRWSEIELDDDQWEVDDAVAADGVKYDLKLDKSFKIVKRERD